MDNAKIQNRTLGSNSAGKIAFEQFPRGNPNFNNEKWNRSIMETNVRRKFNFAKGP